MPIGIKAKFIKMETESSENVPNGSIFLDPEEKITIKSTIGTTQSITDRFVKQMQAGAAPMNIGQPVSKRSDGKFVKADSDSPDGQAPCGILMSSVSGVDEFANVLLKGPNISGILDGKGFVPGDTIYLSENANLCNDPVFTEDNDSFIRMGLADCASGEARSQATDLILNVAIIARPPA